MQFGIAVAIILEHSFFIWDLKRTSSIQPVEIAITTYIKSPQCQVVQQAVKNAFKYMLKTNLENKLIQISLENLLAKENISMQTDV